jgi:hypothetical protein
MTCKEWTKITSLMIEGNWCDKCQYDKRKCLCELKERAIAKVEAGFEKKVIVE